MIRILETVSHWCFNSFETVGANDTNTLRKVWRPLDNGNALIAYSNSLQPDLSQLLLGARVPILLCLDDFSHLIKKSVADGATVMEGVQRATFWYAQVADIAISRLTHTISSPAYNMPVVELAKNILDFLQVKYNDETFGKIRESLVRDDSPLITFEQYMMREFPHLFDDKTSSISNYKFDGVTVDGIVNDLDNSYAPLTEGHPLERVYWHRLLFRYGDVPDKYLHGSVALVGPARTVFFGPYLHLPNGQWTAEVEFEVAGCGNDTIAMADAYDDATISAVSMRLPREGTYSFTIEFETTDFRKPVQIRLQLLKGAIEGEFLLHGIEVKRQSLANGEVAF